MPPGEARARSRAPLLTTFRSLRHQTPICFLAVDGLHSPVFQVVVTAIEHPAGQGEFVEQPGHGIRYQFITRPAGLARKRS